MKKARVERALLHNHGGLINACVQQAWQLQRWR